MGLRQLAESDLGAILEDSDTGFGWPITVTNPDGVSASMVGSSGDISQVIDPDTGLIVSGRLSHVSLRISSLIAAGLSVPAGIADASLTPWLVAFDDINGQPYTFKIVESNPDRTLGFVNCLLELYR